MLADVDGDLLSLLLMSVHQDPLDEVVAVLIASDVDERDSWSIWVRSGDDVEVSVKELNASDLETFLNDL